MQQQRQHLKGQSGEQRGHDAGQRGVVAADGRSAGVIGHTLHLRTVD